MGTVESIYRREVIDTHANFRKALASVREDRYQKIWHTTLVHAAYHGASDIHFTQMPNGGVIELRVDGIKDLFAMLDTETYNRVARLFINHMGGRINEKTQAEARVEESEMPAELKGRFEFRVQYMHIINEIAITLRILNLMNETADVETLGFDQDDLEWLKK